MGEGLLAGIRASHGLVAAIWVGVSLVGVLSPAALRTLRAGGWSLQTLAQVALGALVVTGAILMLDRLADPAVGTLYVWLLAVKLAAVAGLGLLGLAEPFEQEIWARRWLAPPRRQRLLLGLGLAAYVLGSLLTSAYEAVLRQAPLPG
jgi:hypothetical protein